MRSSSLSSRLVANSRQAGCVVLTALDAAARQLVVTQYLEYEGQLPTAALEAGLLKAMLRYPVVTGWIDDRPSSTDGTLLLCWDTHDQHHPGFGLSFTVSHSSKVPSIYSTWELWKAGALPSIEGRMAAAKVTTYPSADRSLLVFAFDHALFDYGASYKFLRIWLQEAALAAAADDVGVAIQVTAQVVLTKHAATGQHKNAAEASQTDGSGATPTMESSASGLQGAQASRDSRPPLQALPYQAEGLFSRSCFFDRPEWSIPKSRQDCATWLQEHTGSRCPFAWDPLDPADSCVQGLKGVLHGSDSQFSVWHIPYQLLKQLKAAAEATCPLPSGMWYSASSAAAAVLVASLYAAAPEKARQLGGLHATTVVDLRGDRCGMQIPLDSMTNASVSGIRVWVPVELLESAAASLELAGSAASTAGPPTMCGLYQLMHHIRLGLHNQLQDSNGTISKQLEWMEAARRAGVAHRVGLCQGLLQFDAGDIVLDWLPAAAELPAVPGTSLTCSSVRMLSSYMDRIVMAMPVPRADGQPGHDIQFEVSFPRSRTPMLYKTWSMLGLDAVSIPAQQGRYWGALDGLLYPYSLWLMVKNTVGCMPWLMLRYAKRPLKSNL